VTRRKIQLVVVRYKEDISWSDAFHSLRTIYDKSGSGCQQVNAGECVALRNVGTEGHTFVHHIYHNYERLAERTVFMHGSEPSCSFFLANGKFGRHLLTNVSLVDYLTKVSDPTYMPITAAFAPDLAITSMRLGFSDRPITETISRPVPAVQPILSHWERWEQNNFSNYVKSRFPNSSQPSLAELHRRLLGRELPPVIYFAQGAQFAASAAALRRVPRATYKWLLELLSIPAFGSVGFWLEVLWPALIGAPVPSAAFAAAHLAQIERHAPAPFLHSLVAPPPVVVGIAHRQPACGNELLLLLRGRCAPGVWDESMCGMAKGQRYLLHVLNGTTRTSINTTRALLESVLPRHIVLPSSAKELSVRYDAHGASIVRLR